MKRFCIVIFLCIFPHVITWAQNIPVSLSYTKVYDFIDELIMDGVVTNQTAIRPYTRNQIADMLTQAQSADSLLSNRQQNELKFYQMGLMGLIRPMGQMGYAQHINTLVSLVLFAP